MHEISLGNIVGGSYNKIESYWGRWEGGSGGKGIYIHILMVDSRSRAEPTQHCKAAILQLKIIDK